MPPKYFFKVEADKNESQTSQRQMSLRIDVSKHALSRAVGLFTGPSTPIKSPVSPE